MHVAERHLYAQRFLCAFRTVVGCHGSKLAVVGCKSDPWCKQLGSDMATVEPAREKSLLEYRKKLLEHKEVESRLKESTSFALPVIVLQRYCWNTHSNVDVVYMFIAESFLSQSDSYFDVNQRPTLSRLYLFLFQ